MNSQQQENSEDNNGNKHSLNQFSRPHISRNKPLVKLLPFFASSSSIFLTPQSPTQRVSSFSTTTAKATLTNPPLSLPPSSSIKSCIHFFQSYFYYFLSLLPPPPPPFMTSSKAEVYPPAYFPKML